jgi:histone-lysine N-methyltransferase SUV39H
VENDAQVGGDFNELVECNSKCGCGPTCINREMQRGLRTPLEMYKTTNKGWAVRTLVPIPRGRFVIEYVGEMLTQTVAHERGLMYDEIKRSYLYDLDYPESKRKPIFTLDGFYSSNVARFINHRSAFLVKFSFFMRVLSCTTKCLFAWCL